MRYKLVDLPGTYSLLSASQDEEVARNFILFGQPDCTIVVTDATALERNLNLVLQVHGDHRQGGGGGQPDGRSPPQRAGGGRAQPGARPGRSGDPDRRPAPAKACRPCSPRSRM